MDFQCKRLRQKRTKRVHNETSKKRIDKDSERPLTKAFVNDVTKFVTKNCRVKFAKY